MGAIGGIIDSAVEATTGSSHGTTLQDFLSHFSSSEGIWAKTIDPFTTFDVSIKFFPSFYWPIVADSGKKTLEKTLEKLALRLAGKVARTKRSVKLEPMNPYERKVIHATLQNHPQVTTRSEGQDPYRRVIIELK